MNYSYNTCGTCSKRIDIDYDPDTCTIRSVAFTGGCNGNTQGISALVKGRPAKEVIATLRGIRCGNKSTSCPDQLACALSEIIASSEK